MPSYNWPPLRTGGGGGTVTAVTASAPLMSSGGNTPDISLAQANGSNNGYLSSADWTTFNSKQSALAFGDLTDAGTDGITITGGTGAVIGSGTSISQHVADASHNGYLSSTDWNTFNSKQSALTFGNLTDVGTDGIVITGGTGAVIGSGTTISQQVADSTHNGYLSSTDWNTFNSKQSALTFPLTVSNGGTGRSTLTANNVILGNGTSTVNFVAPGTSGNILTSNGTTWTSAALTAANTTLSNLGATSINASLLFNADASYNIGSTSQRVNIIRSTQFTGGTGSSIFIPGNGILNDGSLASVNLKLRALYDLSGNNSILFGVNQLKNPSNSTMLDWSGTDLSVQTHLIKDVVDPVDPQDAATKNYVDSSGAKVASMIDSKPSGTDGGTFTSGSWQTRDLNTLIDPNSIIQSFSSNQFVLADGVYEIQAYVPAFRVDVHKAKLYDITNSADILIGNPCFAVNTQNITNHSIITGIFTVVGFTTYEIQHQCTTTFAGTGFGYSAGFGVTETYTQVIIKKLS